MGRNNEALLTADGFDMTLLDQADQMCGELFALRGLARHEMGLANQYLKMRHRAYTHLKEAVDMIRRYGKHVFRYDPERRPVYASRHLRLVQKKNKAQKAASEPTEPNNGRVDVPVDQDVNPDDTSGTEPGNAE